MRTSESIAKIAPALVAIQAELKALAKDGKNPHFNSKFVTFDSIVEHVRPVAAKHGCAIVQDAETTDVAGVLFVNTTLIHESGEWISGGLPMRLQKDDPQGAGSGMSYGKRYGASGMFFLAADEDDDGNAASKPARRAQSQPSPLTGRASEPRPVPAGESTPASSFFGKPKGTPLGEYDSETLKKIVAWLEAKNAKEPSDRIKENLKMARAILADRSLGLDDTSVVNRVVKAEKKAQDALPF